MRVPKLPLLAFAWLCLCVFCVQACQDKELANHCQVARCLPSDRCRTCQCYRLSWDCGYSGYEQCSLGGGFYEMGTVGDSKYIFSLRRMNFSKAQEACQEKGGHLPIFETTEELTAVNTIIDDAPQWTRSRDILIGAYSEDKGKNWTWVNGEKVDTGLYPQTYRYDSFAWFCASKNRCYQKPRGEGPHCLVIEAASSYFNDIWLVKRCKYEQFFICEVPKSVVIPPLEDPAGPKEMGSLGDSAYFLLEMGKPWDVLRRECQADGGDIAVAHSEAVWKFLLQAMKDNNVEDEVYLGASSASGTDRPWKWLDGESLDKDDDRWNWPHPTHTGRSCLVLSGFRGETGNWMDFDCSFSAKGICEKPNTR